MSASHYHFSSTPLIKESSIRHAKDPTIRLLQIILFEQKISKEAFYKRHQQYCRKKHQLISGSYWENHRISSHNNIRKLMIGKHITWLLFCRIIHDILGFEILSVTTETPHPGGGQIVTSYAADNVPRFFSPEVTEVKVRLKDPTVETDITYSSSISSSF